MIEVLLLILVYSLGGLVMTSHWKEPLLYRFLAGWLWLPILVAALIGSLYLIVKEKVKT